MDYIIPYTNRPQDITNLINYMASQAVPVEALEIGTIKKWGFSAASSGYLLDILRKLGFIDDLNRPSIIWREYKVEEKRGPLLASTIKKAYPELFEAILCPYLEDDYSLSDFFRKIYKVSAKNADLMTQTFRHLADEADFQDLLCNEVDEENAAKTDSTLPEVSTKISPDTQLTVHLHIDPQTPDEKIAAIFKNMRKYLLDKRELE